MTAGLTRSLAVKGIAMTLWPCPVGEPCITDVCAAVAQLRESGCDGVIAFGGGSVLDAAKAVALLVTTPIARWQKCQKPASCNRACR